MIEVIVKMLLSSSAFNVLHNELTSRQSKMNESYMSDRLTISDSSERISKTGSNSSSDTDVLKAFSTSHGKPITSSSRQTTEQFDLLTSSQPLGSGEKSELLADSKNVLPANRESANVPTRSNPKSNLKGFSEPIGVSPLTPASSVLTRSDRGQQANKIRSVTRQPEMSFSGSGCKQSPQSVSTHPPPPTGHNKPVCEVGWGQCRGNEPVLSLDYIMADTSGLQAQGSKVIASGQLGVSQSSMVKESLEERAKVRYNLVVLI